MGIRPGRRAAGLASLLLSTVSVVTPAFAQGAPAGGAGAPSGSSVATDTTPQTMARERMLWLFRSTCQASVSSWEGGETWISCVSPAGDGTPWNRGHLFLSDKAAPITRAELLKDGVKLSSICELDITYSETAGVVPMLILEFADDQWSKHEVRVYADGTEVARFNPTAKFLQYSLMSAFGNDLKRMANVRHLKVVRYVEGQDVVMFEGRPADAEAVIVELKGDVAEEDGYVSMGLGSPGPPASGKSCFLTTACCEEIGLADDCFELTALRRYRDVELPKLAGGLFDVATYYALAPVVLAELRNRDEQRVLRRIYFTHILPCAIMARCGFTHATYRLYTDMMVRLCRRYVPQHLAMLPST